MAQGVRCRLARQAKPRPCPAHRATHYVTAQRPASCAAQIFWGRELGSDAVDVILAVFAPLAFYVYRYDQFYMTSVVSAEVRVRAREGRVAAWRG